MKKLLLFCSLLGLFACEKDELPRPKVNGGSANVVSVTIGSDYANQLFYNLSEEKVVLQNNRESWDLAFQSGPGGFYVVLNGSKLMGVYKTTETELSAVTSVGTVDWIWDRPSGDWDSTAIGDWRGEENVYIIDRGTGLSGSNLGKIKLKLLSVNDDTYEIEWAELASQTTVHSTIEKDEAANFAFFSFENGGQTVTIEPPKDTWDICFTSYTHVFDAHTPYLVTGVLSNRYSTRVAAISDKAFSDISYADYISADLTGAINTIGYNWKTYDFDLAIYTVDMSQNFIVETSEGKVFKLHFLDFYDEFGVKGTPSMELQELIP